PTPRSSDLMGREWGKPSGFVSRISTLNHASTTKPEVLPLAEAWIETVPAARFVGAGRADEDALLRGDEPLGMVGRTAADHADRQRLRDVLGRRQQLRHRLERLAEVILIESGHDDALPLSRQLGAHGWQLGIEELPFVDPDHFGIRAYALRKLP